MQHQIKLKLPYLNVVPIDYNSANDDGPRPFGLLLIIVLIISLLIGTSITYYVCCTTPEPIQKKKYPSEGKTTKTKKVTKNAPKKKDHNTKKKPNNGKKEPKTVTILTGNKTKSKAPKSLVGSGSKSKSAANSNSSKANKTKDIKDADNVKSTIYKSLVNGKRDGNKVTMTPLLKKNILGQNVSQVSSMGNLSCRLSKDSVSPRSSNAASANTKTTAMTKMPPLTRRNQKEVSSKKKKLY